MRLKRNWTKRFLVGAVCIAASAAGAWSEVLAQNPQTDSFTLQGSEVNFAAPITFNGRPLKMWVTAYDEVDASDQSASGVCYLDASYYSWSYAGLIQYGFYETDLELNQNDMAVPKGLAVGSESYFSTIRPVNFYFQVISFSSSYNVNEYGSGAVAIDAALVGTDQPVRTMTNQSSYDPGTDTIRMDRFNGVSQDAEGLVNVTGTFTVDYFSGDTPVTQSPQTLADGTPTTFATVYDDIQGRMYISH